MNSIVADAYQEYLKFKQIEQDKAYKSRKGKNTKPSLWPSDLGKCHRAAILRTRGTQSVFAPDLKGLTYMNDGLVAEDETLRALSHVYGDRLTDQVILKHGLFSGKCDFGIDIGTDNPILIEHKMTSEKHVDSDSSSKLPKKEHVGQAMTYMYLYEKIYKITPTVRIFYKTWANVIEFELTRHHSEILVNSYINGVLSVKTLKHDFYAEIETLIKEYDEPELPNKLEKKWKGCEFMGKPSCQFYSKCWE